MNSRLEILMQVKQELTAQRKLHKPFWYFEQGQFGMFDVEMLKKLPNRRIQFLLRQWEKSIREDERQGEEYKSAVGGLFQKVNEEIKTASEQPQRPLIEPEVEQYDLKEYKPSEDWVREIESSAGVHKEPIHKPITLYPNKINAQADWTEEVKTAAQQLLDPWRASPELRKMAREFLAQFESMATFQASIDSFEDSGKVLKISGTALELDRPNKNNWAMSSLDSEQILQTLRGATISCDHSRSVRDNVGLVTEVWKEDKFIKFSGYIDDGKIARLIKKGRIKFVSISGEGSPTCSVCGRGTKPVRACKCEGAFDVVRKPTIKELSIVTSPAYGDVTKIEEFEESDESEVEVD